MSGYAGSGHSLGRRNPFSNVQAWGRFGPESFGSQPADSCLLIAGKSAKTHAL